MKGSRLFQLAATAALSIYYRASRAGYQVPRTGPVLLVANHPNSLLDPALVVYAAERPVRFLAKAPLFTDRAVGWLVRASGAIPVYRKQDDPAQMARNAQMFDAVQRALADGAAVGLFPEGISHNDPSLAPLKTGAARIALGAAQMTGRALPLIPLGLVLPKKSEFRSIAHVIVGEQVRWDDIAARGEDDATAVQDLTSRIERALRRVTVNLESWEDAPVVEIAEAVYAAEFNLPADAAARVSRLQTITDRLARMRREGDAESQELADALLRHARVLRWMKLTPTALTIRPHTGRAIGWTLRRLPLALLAASGIWLVGALLFAIPWLITDRLGRGAAHKGTDLIATTKLIGGTAVYGAWILLLAVLIGAFFGVRHGVLIALLLPVLAVMSVLIHESLRDSLKDAGIFFRAKGRRGGMEQLRERQRELAGLLERERMRGE